MEATIIHADGAEEKVAGPLRFEAYGIRYKSRDTSSPGEPEIEVVLPWHAVRYVSQPVRKPQVWS